MFDQIYIENFKPFQELKLPLSRINLLIGANNAGKTSILEAILTMKELFGHTSYGWHQYRDQIYHPFEDNKVIDFKRVVYAQDEDREIKLGSEVTVDGKRMTKIFSFSPEKGSYEVNFQSKAFCVNVKREKEGIKYTIEKNDFINVGRDKGIAFDSFSIYNSGVPEIEEFGKKFRRIVEKIFFIPSYRGTHKSFREVPSKLYEPEEADLQNVLDVLYFIRERAGYEHVIKMINDFLNRYGLDDIRTLPAPEKRYEVVVRDTKLNIDENISQVGFGINQLLTMMILLSYYPEESLVLIEQPELHMHPRMQVEFAELLPEILKRKRHQILIETHSEHIIFGLLNLIAKKELDVSDINVFYVRKEEKAAKCEKLEVTEEGTVKEGLPEFFEADIDILVEWMRAVSEG